jgi:hypothetical protein
VDEDSVRNSELHEMDELKSNIGALNLPHPMDVTALLTNPEEMAEELPSIEDIIEIFREDHIEKEDEEDVEVRCIGIQEATAALNTLRLFVLQSNDTEEEATYISKYDRLITRRKMQELRQRTILDFRLGYSKTMLYR